MHQISKKLRSLSYGLRYHMKASGGIYRKNENNPLVTNTLQYKVFPLGNMYNNMLWAKSQIPKGSICTMIAMTSSDWSED